MEKVTNVILGLGATGLSYARYLASRGESFTVLDDAVSEDRLSSLRILSGEVDVVPISSNRVAQAENVFVSPGIPLSLPAIAENTTIEKLRGDVQMFGEMVNAPFVAITGTNGKSTLAQLFYEIAVRQVDTVALGGNIGVPCLDILSPEVDLYVLEISSYQLELASKLVSDVAVVLNLSADHLDRYPSAKAYFDTKLALYEYSRSAVVNRMVDYQPRTDIPVLSIGMDPAKGVRELGLLGDAITFEGEALVLRHELGVSGVHNLLNAQAAIAIGLLLDFEIDPMLAAVKSFSGLPHRCQLVAEIDGVRYINDSKGTNPGAMIAAIEAEAGDSNVHLIAGGVAKGTDFSVLEPLAAKTLKRSYLIGEAATAIAQVLSGTTTDIYSDLVSAVDAAHAFADPGDVVLLSPGCASFDQFTDYSERGDVFSRAVLGLLE